MKNCDSHIYLYAKGWYERTDPIEDLKVLYGKRSGIDAEYISISDICFCLITLVSKHAFKTKHQIHEFISDIAPDNVWRVWKFDTNGKGGWFGEGIEYDYWKAVISKCLSILCMVEIKDIENGLDEPDYSLLPMSEHVKKRQEEEEEKNETI